MWDIVLDKLDYPKRTYTSTWRRSKLFTERPHSSCAGDSTNQCTNMHPATAVRSLDSKPIKTMFKQYCVHASHPMRAGILFSTPAQQALHQHLASSLLQQKDKDTRAPTPHCCILLPQPRTLTRHPKKVSAGLSVCVCQHFVRFVHEGNRKELELESVRSGEGGVTDR